MNSPVPHAKDLQDPGRSPAPDRQQLFQGFQWVPDPPGGSGKKESWQVQSAGTVECNSLNATI
jgi:hypothetical protein